MTLNPPKPPPTPAEKAVSTTRRILQGQGVAVGIVIGVGLAILSGIARQVAGRVKKPGAYPAWLFDKETGGRGNPLFDYPVCLWTCSGCGAPFYYRQRGTKHGGPAWRIVDHPEWSPYEGPCWRSREYGVKCVTPRGVRVLIHEGADAPDEALMKALASNARRSRRAMSKDNIVPEEVA